MKGTIVANITEAAQTAATLAPVHAFGSGSTLLAILAYVQSGLEFPISGDRIAEARWEDVRDALEG